MLRLLRIATLMLLFAPLAQQAAAGPQAEVPVPPLVHRVTDLTDTLSQDEQSTLESRLARFEQQQGSQIAILIVPTTQPEAIEQYSIRVVDAWKLGRKGVDDGILILLAKNDRKVRIEVGYGLEGTIPDAIANRIVEETLVPHFKQGDFFGGLGLAIDQLAGLIAGEPLPEPEVHRPPAWEGMLPLLLFGGLVLGAILRAVLGNFLGGAVNGGLIGAAVWLLGGGLLIALVLAVVAFIITLSGGLGMMHGMGRGVYRGGGFGGSGGLGGGTFSGGGGGFGGGGASGSW
jgi:uncharacterized protein